MSLLFKFQVQFLQGKGPFPLCKYFKMLNIIGFFHQFQLKYYGLFLDTPTQQSKTEMSLY